MKLWFIYQNKNNGYDTYDSAVVVASTKERAATMHPDGKGLIDWTKVTPSQKMTWASKREYVQVEYLGVSEDSKPGVVCASFNAG